MSKQEIDLDTVNDMAKALGVAFNEFLDKNPEAPISGQEIVLAFDHVLTLIKANHGRRQLMASLEA